MASSGWQGQKDIQTGKYPHMALNLNVWDVAHSGTTLTFKATVRAIVTSGNIYYNGVSVSLTGGGSISKNMNPVSTGGYVDFGTYNCTISNVSASATTYNVTSSLSAGSTASGSATWTIDIGQGGSTPSGVSVTFVSSTWNSVTATNTVSDWGTGADPTFEIDVVTGNINGEASDATSSNWKGWYRYYQHAAGGASSVNMTLSGSDTYVGSPVAFKGLLHYKLACEPYSYAGTTPVFDDTLRYLPPAPSQFSYTDPGGAGSKTYPVSFTGVASNNNTTYDSASLTRTIRYKIGSGAWTYVDNGTVAAIDYVTSFNVTVPAGQVATVEGWQTYHGMQSEVETIVISNANQGCALYGSVSGQTKKLGPVYASVNGQTKKLIKIYASVGGVTKKVYEDV